MRGITWELFSENLFYTGNGISAEKGLLGSLTSFIRSKLEK